MIILIGGMSHTGKTYISQQLLEKHLMPYLSLDHLKMGLCRGLDEKKYSPVQDYNTLGEKMWPIVKGIIMTAIENNQNLIIEGCYILPHLVYDFDERYLKDIIHLFLGFSEQYIRANFKDIVGTHAKVIENRGYIFSEPLDEYIRQNQQLRDDCTKHNCKYFDLKGNYLEALQEVYKYIASKLN